MSETTAVKNEMLKEFSNPASNRSSEKSSEESSLSSPEIDQPNKVPENRIANSTKSGPDNRIRAIKKSEIKEANER